MYLKKKYHYFTQALCLPLSSIKVFKTLLYVLIVVINLFFIKFCFLLQILFCKSEFLQLLNENKNECYSNLM